MVRSLCRMYIRSSFLHCCMFSPFRTIPLWTIRGSLMNYNCIYINDCPHILFHPLCMRCCRHKFLSFHHMFGLFCILLAHPIRDIRHYSYPCIRKRRLECTFSCLLHMHWYSRPHMSMCGHRTIDFHRMTCSASIRHSLMHRLNMFQRLLMSSASEYWDHRLLHMEHI